RNGCRAMLNVLRQMHAPIGKKPTMPLKDGVILPAPHAPENLTKFAISTHEADPRQRSTRPDLRDPRRTLDAVTPRQVERFEPPSANRHPFGSLTTLAATRRHKRGAGRNTFPAVARERYHSERVGEWAHNYQVRRSAAWRPHYEGLSLSHR